MGQHFIIYLKEKHYLPTGAGVAVNSDFLYRVLIIQKPQYHNLICTMPSATEKIIGLLTKVS